MYVTTPLAVTADNVWLLVEYDEITGVDTFRLGINITNGNYATFPPELFCTDGLVPTYRSTGEPVPNMIWATIADLEANPAFPGHHDSRRNA